MFHTRYDIYRAIAGFVFGRSKFCFPHNSRLSSSSQFIFCLLDQPLISCQLTFDLSEHPPNQVTPPFSSHAHACPTTHKSRNSSPRGAKKTLITLCTHNVDWSKATKHWKEKHNLLVGTMKVRRHVSFADITDRELVNARFLEHLERKFCCEGASSDVGY